MVLCADAYGTPEILLRSGIGPAADLREHDIEVQADLPAAGIATDGPRIGIRDRTPLGTGAGVGALSG